MGTDTRHEPATAAGPSEPNAQAWPTAIATMRASANIPEPRGAYERLLRAGPLICVDDRRWLAVGYATSLQALTDRNLRVRSLPAPAHHTRQAVDLSFSQLDGEEHRRLRRAVSSAFSTAAVAAMAEHVRGNADDLVRAFVDDPDRDFVRDVAEALPLATLNVMLGIPDAARGHFSALARTVSAATDGTEAAGERRRVHVACSDLLTLFAELLRSGVDPPQRSVLATLRSAGSARVPARDAGAVLMLMVVAGIATTTQAITGGTLALATHPSEWAKLRTNTDLVSRAVREVLRYACPILAIRRIVHSDTVLDGHRLRSGQEVIVAVGMAGRDPDVFVAPHEFRVDRVIDTVDLAFAYGPHRCLGDRLAMLEIEAVLTAMVRRFGEVELAGTPRWLTGENLRGLARLPLRVTRA